MPCHLAPISIPVNPVTLSAARAAARQSLRGLRSCCAATVG